MCPPTVPSPRFVAACAEGAVLAGVLAGDRFPSAPSDGKRLLAAGQAHGVAPLLADALSTRGAPETWPARLRHRWQQAAIGAAAVAELQRQATGGVLHALAQVGVRTIVIKGGHLAHTHYAEPGLRPRADTDLLVRRADVAGACAVLQSLGYTPATHTSGEAVTHQCPYARVDRFGVHHVYDLHWKIAEPHLFAGLLTYAEIDAASVALDAFDMPARVPSDIHALVLACIHRVAYHNDSQRVLWLHDVHLLVERLPPREACRFAALAVDRGIAAICAETLNQTRRVFGTRVPVGLIPEPPAGILEPSAAFLGGRLRRVDVLRSDLAALPAWTARWRLLREHLVPTASYMRQQHGIRSSAQLPWAYVRRLARGAGHWFRPIES